MDENVGGPAMAPKVRKAVKSKAPGRSAKPVKEGPSDEKEPESHDAPAEPESKEPEPAEATTTTTESADFQVDA
ncbi:MAG: hypothetical protein V2I33_16410 [Kangiellaceae bacterium]|jgi:hypothetical protein|nr:hypothetical protein [Kangiellaceae bacterium]